MREHGRQRHLGRVGPDPRRERVDPHVVTSCSVAIVQRPRPARARRGEVRPHRRDDSPLAFASARPAARWTARASWGCCCSPPARGSSITISADGPDEAEARRRALRAGGTRLRRGLMRLNGLGVSPGIGVGRALVVTRGSRNLRFRIPERRVPLELERLDAARARSRAQLEHIKTAHCDGRGRRPRLPVRRAAADARRSDAGRARRGTSSGTERLNAESALDRALDEVSALFDQRGRPLPARAQGGRRRRGRAAVHEPAARRRSARPLPRHRRTARAGRRRAQPVAHRADRLAAARGARHRRRQLDVSHRHPGAIAPRARGRRAAHTPAAHSAGRAAGGRRHAAGTSARSAAEMLAELEARSRKRRAYERVDRGVRRAAGGHAATARPSGSKPTSNCRRRPSARAVRGAEGIGLYRSEFLLAGASATGLDEDAQYAIYVRLIDAMAGGRVTVRTFDVTRRAARPRRLGRRGTRAARAARAAAQPVVRRMFQAQLRALLRAAVHGPLRIMFPFVTGVEELRAARAAVAQAAEARCGTAASTCPTCRSAS